MNPADADLVARDPEVPVLALALDPDALGAALDEADPDLRAGGAVEVRRLRYKPGTSVEAAVTLRRPDGTTRWVRLAGYRRGERAKLAKDVASAARRGSGLATVGGDASWGIIDAAADRRLRADRLDRVIGPWTILAYNPGRRLVVRSTAASGPDVVAKVHGPGQARPDGPVLAALDAAGAPIARTTIPRDAHLSVSAWVPGRPAEPNRDGPAVVRSLAWLQTRASRRDRTVLDSSDLLHRAERALRLVADLLPSGATSAATLGDRLNDVLTAEAVGPAGLVHGDLSPDQVVIEPDRRPPRSRTGSSRRGSSRTGSDPIRDREPHGRAVLVDLDTMGRGPRGWDAATWVAAQVAAGVERPAPLPGLLPSPLLLAAALAIRAPEPFQRRRSGWDRTVAAMVDRALDLVGASPERRDERCPR